MGNLAAPEVLIARWQELCRDPSLENLPYKIELSAAGKIEMSPAGNRHGRLQGELAFQFRRQLQGGWVVTECSILTTMGVRVADVAWLSPEFMQAYGEITPYLRAPEICVEIASPSNPRSELEEKTQAYLAAGAREMWVVSEDGTIRYFSASGEISASAFSITVALPPPAR